MDGLFPETPLLSIFDSTQGIVEESVEPTTHPIPQGEWMFLLTMLIFLGLDEVASEKVTKIRLFAFEIFYRSKVSDLRIAVRNPHFEIAIKTIQWKTNRLTSF